MSGQEENAQTDPWRHVAIGAGSIFDLSGQATRDAMRKASIEDIATKTTVAGAGAVTASAVVVATAWAAVGEAIANAMQTIREELGR